MTPFGTRRSAASDLDDELRTHISMDVEDRVAKGLARPEAEKAALEEFGDVERVKRAARWAATPLPLVVLEALMNNQRRLMALAGGGVLALAAAAFLPFDALMLPRANDWLSYQTTVAVGQGEYVEVHRYTCVSGFHVVADGVIRFTVEPSLHTPSALVNSVGKKFTVASRDFTLMENAETCKRS